MIKRRFYKQEHGDNSGNSDSSSSDDSDFSLEADTEEDHRAEAEGDEEEEEEEEEEEKEEQGRGSDKKTPRCPSPGSGYESEDSSNGQDDRDASDLLTNEEHQSDEKDVQSNKNSKTIGKVPVNAVERAPEVTGITMDPNDPPVQADISNFMLKCKSVFKCKLCPRVICLNEATVRTHFASKRHAWSKKLFVEGRLTLMLNSKGELEEEQETHAERHARILDLSQKPNSSKKDTGRQRQSRRRKKRMRRSGSLTGKSETTTKNGVKKRRTSDN